MRKLSTLLLLLFTLCATAQTANDFASYVPYQGKYAYGLNPGWYGFNWITREILELGSGGPNTKGIGAKTARMQIYDDYLTRNGLTSLVKDYDKLVELGYKDIAVMLGSVSEANRWNPLNYPDNQWGYPEGKMWKGMYEPAFTSDGQINPVNTYAKYLYDVARVYGKYVTFWEIINEPDFTYGGGGWTGDSDPPGAVSWFYKDPTPDDLVNLRATVPYYNRLLRVAWEVLKKYCPGSYICTGGIGARSFLDCILKYTDNPVDGSVTAEYPLKGGAYFDVLSFHTYPEFFLRNWARQGETPTYGDGFVYYRHSDSAISKHLLAKNRMDAVLKKYGYNSVTYPAKQFICTETGISRHTNISTGGNDFGGNEVQRNYMIKAHVKTQMDGQIRQTYWYSTADGNGQNPHWDAFGCYYWFGDVKPWNAVPADQGIAQKTTSDLLYGRTYDPVRTASLNLPASIDGGAFQGSGGYVYVLWARTSKDLSEQAQAVYTFPSNMIRKEWDYSKTKATTTDQTFILTGTPSFFEKLVALPIEEAPRPGQPPVKPPKKGKYKVYNVVGQLIKQGKDLDKKHLPKGRYLLIRYEDGSSEKYFELR